MPDTSETSPPPPPPIPTDSGSGLPPALAAGIASIFQIVGGIVFLVLERKNQFVRFCAMQAVIFGLLAILAGILFRIADVMFFFMPVGGHLILILLVPAEMIFWLVWLACYVVAIFKAFNGQEWEIPWVGKIARRQLAKTVL